MRETAEGDEPSDEDAWNRPEPRGRHTRPADYDRPFDQYEQKAAELSGLEVGRVRPVLTYELDKPSRATARECGSVFVDRMPVERWARADVDERRSAARALQLDIAFRLGVDVHPVAFEPMPGNRAGSFNRQNGSLVLNETLLEQSDPKELIMTLAHEQRHVWQDDVVEGRKSHPGGPEASERLREGAADYYDDYVDLGPDGTRPRYRWNELERDAETFGYALYSRYRLQRAMS